MSISIVGPIIIAGSIGIAVFIGFFMGESITFLKVLGLGLLIVGAGILAAISG